MGKIKYLCNRLLDMNYKQIYTTAQKIHERSGKNILTTTLDIMFCGYKYMAGYMDYLVFEFEKLNAKQRETYITRGVNNLYVKTLNQKDSWYKLEDKPTFNRIFSEYLHHDWILLSECTCDEFMRFVQDKDKLVCKPVDATCGRGIEILNKEDYGNIPNLFNRLKNNGQLLVEEYIVQHPKIAEIYPDSVNTIRLVTMTVNQTPHVVFSSIRIGNGLKVDNLNSGGMATIIDLDSGIITKPAMDKKNILYYQHPATGTELVGRKIPYFNEALDMVKNAALVIPEMGYIAWDVAITINGPLLIEANHFPGHDIYQFQPHLDNGIGLKPRFDKVFNNKDSANVEKAKLPATNQ